MSSATDEDSPDFRWLADQLAIRNLIARLAQLADSGDLTDYAECWTEDGEWSAPPGSPGVASDAEPRRGIDDLIRGTEERRAAGVQGPGTHTRHVVSTTLITADGPDRARGRSYWRYYTGTDAGNPQLAFMGQYDDEFVRTRTSWRLAKRVVTRN